MKRNLKNKTLGIAAAGLACAALAGCTVGPVTLPDIDLGILKGVGIVTTSVADAESAIRDERDCGVDSAELVSPGTLTVGVLPTNTAPLICTKDDGSRAGIDVEFAYALGDHVGLPVTFKAVSSATASLGTDCDIVVGASTAAAGSATNATVVGDYAESAIGLFARGKQGELTATDLKGKTVGVQPGSVSERALSNANTGCVEQSFANINEAMSALGSGTIDAVVCDAYAGCYLAADYDDVNLIGTLDTPVALGVAVSSAKPTLTSAVQSAVDAVQSNGQLDVIKSRWVGQIGTLTSASMLQGITAAPAAAPDAAATAAPDAAAAAAPAATPAAAAAPAPTE